MRHGAAAATPVTALPAAPRPRATTPPTDLVDRSRETAVLRRAVDDVVAGRSGCVLVEGPAGIGKSRLLVEAARLATAGGAVRVLSARGSPLEQSFGFGDGAAALRALHQRPRPARGAAQRCGRAAATVFDEVAGEPPAHHGQLRRAPRSLLADGEPRRRGARSMIVVDDVQWCDSASLRYLAYLVKRLEGLPVLVVLARRTGEQQPDDALLAEIALDASVTVLRPAPLSAQRRPRWCGSVSVRARRPSSGLPPHDLGQPAAAAPAAACAGGRGDPPRRVARRHRPGRGVARRVGPGDAAAAPDVERSHRRGASGRRARRGRRAADGRCAGPAARGAGRRSAGHA